MLKLMYITNNPVVAIIAQKYGVDRIWIDLEYKGKEERQKGLNSVKSKHSVQDIRNIAPLLDSSKLLVRINPWGDDSREEIEEVINAGADIIMLPMWKSQIEVKAFLSAVNNRIPVILLLETREAVECLDEVLELNGINEIHIGLNDLHLSYGYNFIFEPLANGLVEYIATKCKKAGITYGFGGIAGIGKGALLAEKIIMEHYRLGSSIAILSRSFCDVESIGDFSKMEKIFSDNIKALKAYESTMSNCTEEDFQTNKIDVIKCIKAIASVSKERIMHAD